MDVKVRGVIPTEEESNHGLTSGGIGGFLQNWYLIRSLLRRDDVLHFLSSFYHPRFRMPTERVTLGLGNDVHVHYEHGVVTPGTPS